MEVGNDRPAAKEGENAGFLAEVLVDFFDRTPGAVDPGPEARVARVVMSEFVGEDGAKLSDGKHLKQRQPEAHNSALPASSRRRRFEHERIGVGNEVDLGGHGLVEGRR